MGEEPTFAAPPTQLCLLQGKTGRQEVAKEQQRGWEETDGGKKKRKAKREKQNVSDSAGRARRERLKISIQSVNVDVIGALAVLVDEIGVFRRTNRWGAGNSYFEMFPVSETKEVGVVGGDWIKSREGTHLFCLGSLHFNFKRWSGNWIFKLSRRGWRCHRRKVRV